MKRTISLCLTFLLLISNAAALAEQSTDLGAVIQNTADYICQTVPDPQVASIGGEWAVIGLARSGVDISEEYYANYYHTVEKFVKACDGVLHDKKYTEYSRVILALTAIGRDPADVAGYNLLVPLGDYEKTIWQGINGPVWALLALDSGDYEIPLNPSAAVQATREMYLNRILECQLPNGSWSFLDDTDFSDSTFDPDVTGMVLQALAKYQDNARVKAATEKALTCISEHQNADGGFSGWGTENSESCAQILVALCELGISLEEVRFVKNGNTVLDYLMTYYENGKGFKHTYEGSESNQMATEQGFYSLAAVKRLQEGKSSLYRMQDALKLPEDEVEKMGLPGKNPDVQKMEIVSPGKTFADINAHQNQPAIEALASRNIINGKSDSVFEPDATMTRAEFATIVVKGLGLPARDNALFYDVTVGDWFFGFVNTACTYGIVKGVSETAFEPNGIITREEAAVMIARAAKLCGMDTEMDVFEFRDILAEFLDYVKASDWAVGSLAFCYDTGILSDSVMEIKPKEAVVRAEIAQMLFNMLHAAGLL